MNGTPKFVVAACIAVLGSALACDVDEVAQGEAAQQRVTLKPTAKAELPGSQAKPQLPDPTKPQVDIRQEETNEQRLRRLKNEGTRDRCLEMLEAALGATSSEYRESDCTLKFKKNASNYIFANLNYADAKVEGRKLSFTCRDKERQGNCVGSNSPVESSTVGWQINADASGGDLQRCLDFLHERCKEM